MEVSVDEMFQTFAVLLKLKHRSDILRSFPKINRFEIV